MLGKTQTTSSNVLYEKFAHFTEQLMISLGHKESGSRSHPQSPLRFRFPVHPRSQSPGPSASASTRLTLAEVRMVVALEGERELGRRGQQQSSGLFLEISLFLVNLIN